MPEHARYKGKMKYAYNRKKSGRRVHILNGLGTTYCKAENGGARLNEIVEEAPNGRRICTTCQHLFRQDNKKNNCVGNPKKGNEHHQSDRFYQSWDWKQLRYRVLKHYGRKCMCCGASPEDGKVIVVDHIKSVKRYPDLRLKFSNCQVLCNDCNMGKSGNDETDFREPLPDGAYEHLDAILRN